MNPEARRHVLRMLTHGLYVAAAADGDDRAANTITWLTQTSIKPPLLVAAIRADGWLHALIERARAFAVSILGADQQDLAAVFFRPSQVEGNLINSQPFIVGEETGAPILLAAPAWLEARVVETVRRGDHTIFVAEMVKAGVHDPTARPLALHATPWSYGG